MKKSASMERSKTTAKILTYAVLILGAIIMIFPFVWMILTSSKTVPESMQIPPTIFPAQIMLDNFKDAIASLPFLHLYFNTGLMVFFRVVCAVVFSSMAGYAFAKLHFRGKNLLFGIVLVQMSLPSQIFIIPQYQMVAKMGLATLRGQFSTNFPILMAGSLLAMLPMVILYLIFQKQFIEGIASTGGK